MSTQVKLEELSEEDSNDVDMEEQAEDGHRPPTLQDTVGNVIKSYYQEAAVSFTLLIAKVFCVSLV